MNQASRRSFRIFGIVVALILVSLAFYPGTFASTNTAPQYSHSVTPESAENYEYLVGRIEDQRGSDSNVYEYDELSPRVQDLFDRTRSTNPGEGYDTPVCANYMLFCDGQNRGDLLDREVEEFSLPEDIQTRDAFVSSRTAMPDTCSY